MRHTPEETTTNLISQATRLRASGQIEAARTALIEGLSRNEHGGPADKALLLRELAECHLAAGDWADGHVTLNQAMALVDDFSSRYASIRAAILERKAWAYFREWNFREAESTANSVLDQLGRFGDPADAATLAGAHNTIGGIAWQQSRIDEALANVKRAAELFQQAGDEVGAANARTNLGILLYTNGRWSQAQQQFMESDRMRRASKTETGRASNLLNLGLLEMSMGEHHAARLHLAESLQLSLEYGQQYDAAHAEIALAQLDLIESKIDDACRNLDSVLSRGCICDDDRVQAAWLQALVECDRGAAERAAEIATEARHIAQSSQLLESEADCCRALAEAERRRQRYDEAESALRDSISLAERAGDPYRRALAMLDLAAVCHECGDTSRSAMAHANVNEAERVFTQLGARHDLSRAVSMKNQL